MMEREGGRREEEREVLIYFVPYCDGPQGVTIAAWLCRRPKPDGPAKTGDGFGYKASPL